MDTDETMLRSEKEPSGPPAEANWIQTRAASGNGLDESHPCLKKWAGWIWRREKRMVFAGEGTWKTSALRGHSRDRHAIIINTD